jgi:hypothetical protein
MIRPMRLVEPLIELLLADRTAPKESMLGRSRRNDPKPAAGAGGQPFAATALDDRRVDLLFGAIAIDRGSRRSRDHGADAALDCPPGEPIDEGIFEQGQRGPAGCGHCDKPVGVLAARMRYRKQHREVRSGRVDEGRTERCHG